jgi:lipoate-protein ligase A
MNSVLQIDSYDLPDAQLMKPSAEAARCCVFVPQRTMVVIGKGSDPALELYEENILSDGVPVLRRGTGGCAVVLTPQMLAVSFAVQHTPQLKSSEYFRLFNAVIIRALKEHGIRNLEHAGTSDIALSGRKLAGTAIYRNRQLVFYHAIINLAGSAAAIARYLKHPPRVPAYRAGRSHEEFVTSLAEAGFTLPLPRFGQDVEREFRTTVTSLLRVASEELPASLRKARA